MFILNMGKLFSNVLSLKVGVFGFLSEFLEKLIFLYNIFLVGVLL